MNLKGSWVVLHVALQQELQKESLQLFSGCLLPAPALVSRAATHTTPKHCTYVGDFGKIPLSTSVTLLPLMAVIGYG